MMPDIPSAKSPSLRDRVKDKLLTPSGSIRLPRFLTNEPAAPARYPRKPLGTSKSNSIVEKEQWYVPPAPPTPERRARKKEVNHQRDSDPVRTPFSWVEGSEYFLRPEDEEQISPRPSSSPERCFPEYSPSFHQPEQEDDSGKLLRVYDLRNQSPNVHANLELHAGFLFDLIQTIPSVWLTNSRIQDSFTSLLRSDQVTTTERRTTVSEWRIIEGFLQHLPDVHILPQSRIRRKSAQASQDYKRNLNLSSELINDFEEANPKTRVIYSLLIIASLLHEISLWILQQLLLSDVRQQSDPIPSPLIVQHYIFGGVLMLETHPEEDPELAFVDMQGEAWLISAGWLLFKFAEGPDGMPFESEVPFQRRRCGVVRRIGGVDGGLEGFD